MACLALNTEAKKPLCLWLVFSPTFFTAFNYDCFVKIPIIRNLRINAVSFMLPKKAINLTIFACGWCSHQPFLLNNLTTNA